MSNESIKEELYLILGCFGRVDGGFVSCASCENRILRIDGSLEQYNSIMEYMDTCRLFDKPTFDVNAIRHVINNMQERFDQIIAHKRLWPENKLQLFQKFIQEHRSCGLYLKLSLIPKDINSDEIKPVIEEKPTEVKALSAQKKIAAAPKVNLKLIRGRR